MKSSKKTPPAFAGGVILVQRTPRQGWGAKKLSLC